MILENHNMKNKYLRVAIWEWKKIFPASHSTYRPGQRSHSAAEDANVSNVCYWWSRHNRLSAIELLRRVFLIVQASECGFIIIRDLRMHCRYILVAKDEICFMWKRKKMFHNIHYQSFEIQWWLPMLSGTCFFGT